jgi:excisionase family DNA binding protein
VRLGDAELAGDVTCTFSAALLEALAHRAAQLALAEIRNHDAARLVEYITVAEAAAYLRCSRQRIYDLRSSGRLTSYADGSRALVRRSELDRHVRAGVSRVATSLPPARKAA